MKKRVLIVDDSVLIRRVLQDWVKESDDFEVVGVAVDGTDAIAKAKELKPDFITLDVEMPRMDGLQALAELSKNPDLKILMVSSVTTAGAEATLRALELGAYDFLPKPIGSSSFQFLSCKEDLLEKLRAGLHLSKVSTSKPVSAAKVAATSGKTDKVILLASSTGGPKTVSQLFESMPKGLEAPMMIVQHMPQGFTSSFAKRLNGFGVMEVTEAKEGDQVKPGHCLVAPGGKHMVVTSSGHIALNEGPTLHGVRPAADHLFKSAATYFGARCVGIVLTGMGKDGADGAVAVRQAGGYCLGESEETATIYGMPRAAKEAGGIDEEHPIHEMASALMGCLSGTRRARAS